MPPVSRAELDRRIRAARRRPKPSGEPAGPDDVDQAERDILFRQSAAVNEAALPVPKQNPSKPS